MKKYNWTIDDLKARYDLLLNLQDKENDPEKMLLIAISIENLYEDILDLESKEDKKTPRLLDNYNYNKSLLTDSKYLWNDICLFNEEADLKINKTPILKTVSLSKDDILELTHDFYKTYLDKFFFHNFLKHYRNRYTNIKFKTNDDEYMGETIHIMYLQESFITVVRNFNIEDVLTTIHEYAHATNVTINPYSLASQNYPFCEIGSIFAELIGADYLDNIFKNGEAYLSRANDHKIYHSISNNIKNTIDLINAEETYYENGYTSNKILKTSAVEHCGIALDKINNLIQKTNISYSYVISYIFAIELYKLYQEDKDKALNILRKIVYLNCRSEEDFYKSIKRLGLIPNYHTREYTKEIVDNVLKLKKKD